MGFCVFKILSVCARFVVWVANVVIALAFQANGLSFSDIACKVFVKMLDHSTHTKAPTTNQGESFLFYFSLSLSRLLFSAIFFIYCPFVFPHYLSLWMVSSSLTKRFLLLQLPPFNLHGYSTSKSLSFFKLFLYTSHSLSNIIVKI